MRFGNLEIRRQGTIPELVPENLHATYCKHQPFYRKIKIFKRRNHLPHHENNQEHFNQSAKRQNYRIDHLPHSLNFFDESDWTN